MPDPPILVIPKGTPTHPRYLIGDQQYRVWTGEGSSTKATGFSSPASVKPLL